MLLVLRMSDSETAFSGRSLATNCFSSLWEYVGLVLTTVLTLPSEHNFQYLYRFQCVEHIKLSSCRNLASNYNRRCSCWFVYIHGTTQCRLPRLEDERRDRALVPGLVRSSHICELVRVFVSLVVVGCRFFMFPGCPRCWDGPRSPDTRRGWVVHYTDDFWSRLIPTGHLAWVMFSSLPHDGKTADRSCQSSQC